ncbi:unnamed protein product [Mytilus coruscus]|uniref:Reverse transcriptase domain-containing protein n=1 Tax=Mytilus coruscus TaxID=42192 RepID=A0A6J8CCE0_MYTCO|nr:unnamed protein product [Mytilus coruscus]
MKQHRTSSESVPVCTELRYYVPEDYNRTLGYETTRLLSATFLAQFDGGRSEENVADSSFSTMEVLESKVKWMGDTSDNFNIRQGVRQGGILATHLYTLYVQNLLEELKNNSIGFHLGNIYIGAPTCADDIALLSSDTSKMQLMLDIIGRYADQHQYNIHPTKTKIVQCNTKDIDNKWLLKGTIIEPTNAKHI